MKTMTKKLTIEVEIHVEADSFILNENEKPSDDALTGYAMALNGMIEKTITSMFIDISDGTGLSFEITTGIE